MIHINCPTSELYFKSITILLIDLSDINSQNKLKDLSIFFQNWIKNNPSATILKEKRMDNSVYYKCSVINNMIMLTSCIIYYYI